MGTFPGGIELFKVNTRAMYEICWRRSAVFIVDFEQIPHIVLVFTLLTLNK